MRVPSPSPAPLSAFPESARAEIQQLREDEERVEMACVRQHRKFAEPIYSPEELLAMQIEKLNAARRKAI